MSGWVGELKRRPPQCVGKLLHKLHCERCNSWNFWKLELPETAGSGLSRGMRKSGVPSALRGRLLASLDEREQVAIDLICVGGRHSVRKAGINLQRGILNYLCG